MIFVLRRFRSKLENVIRPKKHDTIMKALVKSISFGGFCGEKGR